MFYKMSHTVFWLKLAMDILRFHYAFKVSYVSLDISY